MQFQQNFLLHSIEVVLFALLGTLLKSCFCSTLKWLVFKKGSNLDMKGRKIASVSSLGASWGNVHRTTHWYKTVIFVNKFATRNVFCDFFLLLSQCENLVNLEVSKNTIEKVSKNRKWGGCCWREDRLWILKDRTRMMQLQLQLYYQTARKLLYALTDVAVSSIKRSFEVLTNGSRMNTDDTEQPSPILALDF